MVILLRSRDPLRGCMREPARTGQWHFPPPAVAVS